MSEDSASAVVPILKPAPAYVNVTPEVAQRWLNGNTVNRKIRAAKVHQYARDMKAGRWTLSNDAICFDPTGKLLNGQHRLRAVIEAGMTITMLIIRNMDPESMGNMDSGSARTAADALHLDGVGHANMTAAAAKQLILYCDGRIYKDNKTQACSHGEIRDFIEQNPDIIHSVRAASTYGREIDCSNSVLAAAHWIISTRNPTAVATQFLEALSHRSNLPDGSPILAIDSRLRKARTARSQYAAREYLALIIKGWNYHAAGKPVRTLSIGGSKSTHFRIPDPARQSRR